MASPMPDDDDFTPMSKEELEENRKAYERRHDRQQALNYAVAVAGHRAGLTEEPDQVINRILETAKKFESYLNGAE